MTDFYTLRHELQEGQVFELADGSRVMLERRVPGDGTKWYVSEGEKDEWYMYDRTIEPGELVKFIEDANEENN